MPVFITSDSILNAYHVLLEESVLRLDLANADELPEVLQFVWKNLDSADRGIQGDKALVAAAKRRARIVVGTAIALVVGSVPEVDPATAAVIQEEVARVEKAEGLHKPAWLGPEGEPDLLAIDYSRFKPRGFYTAGESLSRYFRAASWLQAIPFRVDRDEELLAALMLGDCMATQRFAGDEAKQRRYAAFFECFREFLGERDDWDLTTAAAQVDSGLRLDLGAGDLERVRQSLLAKAARPGEQPQVNDQIALPNAPGPAFRVLSAYRTPDAVLFQRTTDLGEFQRPLPTGLEVCIALGSAMPRECLDDPEREKVLETIERSKDLFSGKNLYGDYLRCLSTLFGAPAAGAPDFMSRGPWQAKSCQTALAGWAQWRHTWVLQSKETCVWASKNEWKQPVGFVEPNPAFFAGLRDLAERTARLLERVKTKRDPSVYAVVELHRLLRILEAKAASGGAIKFHDLSAADDFLRRAYAGSHH